jgi:colanic acid biosynthesis glycosyl transferase WcaI
LLNDRREYASFKVFSNDNKNEMTQNSLKILFVSRDFFPDEVAISLYVTDLAIDLQAQGHSVSIVAGDYCYDSPMQRLAHRETLHGINIYRIWATRFPKRIMTGRMVNSLSFSLMLSIKMFFLPWHFDCVIGLTTPPMISLIAAVFARLRRAPFIYWVMDLQPDEAVAAGVIAERSLVAALLRRMNGMLLNWSKLLVVLDRYMADRLCSINVPSHKIVIIPPWSSLETSKPIAAENTEFRQVYNLQKTFVVMYSGNHSICHPLDTLLEATLAFRDIPDFRFVFVGGGVRRTDVAHFKERHQLTSIVQIPFQPREKLFDSLCAADVHIMVMGSQFVGIIHPSKIYAALAVGRPTIVIGPGASAAADLVRETGSDLLVEHSEINKLVSILQKLHFKSNRSIDRLANRSVRLIEMKYSRQILTHKFINAINGLFSATKSDH